MAAGAQGYLSGFVTFLLVLASLFATCGAVLPHTAGYAAGADQYGHHTVLKMSLGITTLSASLYSLIHLGAFASDFWRLS